jgi:transcriptional regulator with XRE-family HTH domain
MAREDTGPTVGPLSLFCARLKRLQQAAGLTQASLAAVAGLSTSQMSAILNGDIKNLPDWDVVNKVVRACLSHAEQPGKTLTLAKDLRDEDEKGNKEIWRRRYGDLEQDFRTAARPRRDTQKAAERTVQTVGQCDPFDLEVHRVLLPTGTVSLADGPEPLTPYLKRDHDTELHAALRRAAAGEPSMFAVLAGDSCTGKTRALYEALLEAVPDWPLLRPADADELLELLHEGRFRAGTVLWLNETQRHLYGTSGERAANLLRSTLAATDGAVAVGALWPRPYLEELTAAGNSPDVHSAARALLDGPRTHCITVPNCLTGPQQQELGALGAADERLGAALLASGPDRDVIQHLTGGPELLRAYTSGGQFFTPVEHALITAALDARRLGYQEPIPAALLAAAADGYLSPRQRPGHADWASSALTCLTTGIRPDGTRTGIRNTLTALKTMRARSGDAETGYEPDDYLDQHTRRTREACLGPRQLWDALAEHTTGPDRYRLGDAACDRGLYQYAALLWKHTITATGDAEAAFRLIDLLRAFDRDGTHHAAHWVSERAALDNPFSVGELLKALGEAGADRAVTTLATRVANDAPLDRTFTNDAPFDSPFAAKMLLEALREAGADEAVSALAARAANHVALDPPGGVAVLKALREAGADEAVSALGARAANHVALDPPEDVAVLLKALREAGADEAVSALAARGANDAPLDEPSCVPVRVGGPPRVAGADEAVSALAARAANHVALDEPSWVLVRVGGPRVAGADEAVSALAARAANAGLWELSLEADPGKARQYKFGRQHDGAASAPWGWQDLTD